MNEHILPAIIGLDKAVAFCAIVKLHCACRHFGVSLLFAALKTAASNMI